MEFILKQLREMPRFYMDKSICGIDDGEREEKGVCGGEASIISIWWGGIFFRILLIYSYSGKAHP